jgi:transcriptional regulatory protein RtcR
MKPTVLLGFVGSTLDTGRTPDRWGKWRPSVSACQQPDLAVSRFELLHDKAFRSLALQVSGDIRQVSPETKVVLHEVSVDDAWDFEQVYGRLHDFARGYAFQPEREDYLIHISTGTHVIQICWFLLAESRDVPARLLQTGPGRGRDRALGTHAIIDLDLSKYDRIAARFQQRSREARSFLKAGIETRNVAFNKVIEQIEHVSIASRAPILLMGPTGAGKSQLARRIYELKRSRRQLEGSFVDVNCATLRGETAMSALFGHARGAFTGAQRDRPGLLRQADRGLLFLDEIGELGSDEQAMLLRAIEDGTFYPVGSDAEARSNFQLIAGTNRALARDVQAGRFREDLLARINLWTYRLPPLRDRREDIEPNLDFELDRASAVLGARVTFSKEARTRFLSFALGPAELWSGNFRDLAAAMSRMATLAPGGRIDEAVVEGEVERLRRSWAPVGPTSADDLLPRVLGAEAAEALDRFDRVQLADVLRVCAESRSLSEAGRVLFARTREAKSSANDADRLRKYLARFELEWKELRPRLEATQ